MRYLCSPDDDDFDFFDDSDEGEEQEEYEDDEEFADEGEEEEFEDEYEDSEESEEYEDSESEFEDELPEVDERAFASAEDFPNADEEDFEDDEGDWSEEDYAESATNLFGEHPFFGDTLTTQLADNGFRAFTEPGFAEQFDRLAPGAGETAGRRPRDCGRQRG